jgi:molybdate transport system regulatory protein
MPSPRRKAAKSEPIELHGAVWMTVAGENLGGHGRVGLLRAIAETGSITHGAKAIGLSYKAAWDAIDTMNNVAGAPLVERSAGGRGGGSTRLTERGQQLVERYARIDALHRRFVQLLSDEATDLASDLDLLRMLNMKTSARNQFAGTVSAVKPGAVNDEIELTLAGGARVIAVVTHSSAQSLQLEPGATAFALIKASSVIVATDLEGATLSARNQLPGTVSALHAGAVNAEVVLDLDGGGSIAAVVTLGSAKALGLKKGARAIAIFKASSVILGAMA